MNCQTDKKVVIIIPIYKPDNKFTELLKMLNQQRNIDFDVYIIDSGDDFSKFKSAMGNLSYTLTHTTPREFNHGGTRRKASEACAAYPILVYMTQDAIPADEYAIYNLVHALDIEHVGCAYGRQLPHKDANILAARARLFNYPPKSQTKQLSDAKQLGIKVSFISDTFAVYRHEVLNEVGGFPEHVILGEDTYVASKMILAGWKIRYCAESKVYHSHNYSIMQEFRRYFDIGVFHAQEPWIREAFGEAEGEGKRFVIDELKYLLTHKPLLVPKTIFRDGMKFLGYRLGIAEGNIPCSIKEKMSMVKMKK